MSNKNHNMTDEITKLIQQGDNDQLEFRRHSGGPNLLSKLISSFANASGGKLIIGVDEKGKISGCKKSQLWTLLIKLKKN